MGSNQRRTVEVPTLEFHFWPKISLPEVLCNELLHS